MQAQNTSVQDRVQNHLDGIGAILWVGYVLLLIVLLFLGIPLAAKMKLLCLGLVFPISLSIFAVLYQKSRDDVEGTIRSDQLLTSKRYFAFVYPVAQSKFNRETTHYFTEYYDREIGMNYDKKKENYHSDILRGLEFPDFIHYVTHGDCLVRSVTELPIKNELLLAEKVYHNSLFVLFLPAKYDRAAISYLKHGLVHFPEKVAIYMPPSRKSYNETGSDINDKWNGFRDRLNRQLGLTLPPYRQQGGYLYRSEQQTHLLDLGAFAPHMLAVNRDAATPIADFLKEDPKIQTYDVDHRAVEEDGRRAIVQYLYLTVVITALIFIVLLSIPAANYEFIKYGMYAVFGVLFLGLIFGQ